MNLVCEKCHRVYAQGKWVHGVPPIEKVQTTICPYCEKGEDTSSGKGMVYQDKVRKEKNKK